MSESLPWLDAERAETLHAAAAERILVVDGAMGTSLQDAQLTPDDFGGADLDGCNEILVETRPDVIRDVHDSFLSAGADIVETDTFGGTSIVLAEYGLESRVAELNEVAARLAREACAAFDAPGRPRFVAGSIGPTTKAISVTGGVTFDELRISFRDQARALVAGGSDLLLVETSQDTRNVKAALLGIQEVFEELGARVPVATSCTIEPTGTMLAGQGVEAFWTSVAHTDLFSVGLNCATGPDFMTDHVRSLSELARHRVSCIPNAGLPNEDGEYELTPDELASTMRRFAEHGWLNVVGGCCGTRPDHIAALARAVADVAPRRPIEHRRSLFSGIDFLETTDDNRPVLVGERTNVIGSRKFKRLIVEERFEEAAEIGRAQVKGGAHLVDVCLANPDRDEMEDTERFLAQAINKVTAPFVVDSTDPEVIERALTWCQGKALINSINLEDGEERFEQVVPLARRFGAALVVGCIDEDPVQGMGVTRQRKLEIARRSHELLTKKYGVRDEDIVFDPLVFPCATGAEEYVGSGVETIEGVRLIDHAFPHCRTILGISNVSFGLPVAGREVLNAVFLYHCTKAGLDMAIVNTEKLERYASIPEEERRLAEDLLWNRGDDPIAAFAAHFKGRASHEPRVDRATLPPDERIAACIVEGTKEGLTGALDEKLADGMAPLDIVNGPLMSGMDEVGRLFASNELIVAEVLQSAEAMKAAVSHLEPHMEKADAASKGKIVLATVKGDVHDIGKNLVDIILSNNGFDVVNLGIKVPPADLVAAVREHAPDAIGLSGLLVKSAQQMVVTAEDLREAGIDAPILVGGAALSRNFTVKRIAPAYGDGLVLYAQDAMNGLALMDRVVRPDERAALHEEALVSDAKPAAVATLVEAAEAPAVRSTEVRTDIAIPAPPDLDEHVEEMTDLDDVFAWINPAMLYGRHMGLKGATRKLGTDDPKARKVEAAIEDVQRLARDGALHVRAAWRFFEAEADGNALRLFDGGGEIACMTFPRQRRDNGLCLADYVLPSRDGRRDHVAVFVTTAGEGIRERAEALKEAGEFVRCHALQALAIESAEAAAELLHARLRNAWGFGDAVDMTMMQRFQARYRGKRYSPGYPACPELELQEDVFRLLRPERIGVTLTDGHMMEPEASVSALVFHHPDATYFSV
jgi:5-methyltetrahydrofolate--homocysteine methyltransferase